MNNIDIENEDIEQLRQVYRRQYWLNVAKSACIGALAAPLVMLGVALLEVGICAMIAVAIKCTLYFVGAM